VFRKEKKIFSAITGAAMAKIVSVKQGTPSKATVDWLDAD
jgi:hypothetical protein